MKTYMFPGQGSQRKGMGGELFDEFTTLTKTADEILGYSIKELCLEDPRKELGKTQFTQPALYVVNALSYYKKIAEMKEKPDFVIGHSLGEFNALLAAGCFSFSVGLKLVQKRGELMSQVSGGGMAAVSNAGEQEIRNILDENGLTRVALANFNTPSQIVISGMREDIVKAQSLFQQDTMMYHPLNTSGAFHSVFMESSQKKFTAFLNEFSLSAPVIPVISNVTAKPYRDDEIQKQLSAQIASPVKWSSSVEHLIAIGDSKQDEMKFEELGYGRVLSGLVHKIRNSLGKIEGPLLSKFKTDNFIDAGQQVKSWNAKYPVGTKVASFNILNKELETRTQAVVLFGHRAALYVQNYNGYFSLNEISPLS